MQHHVEFDIDFKRNSYSGKFIAIEGIDGSGKTTQVKKIFEYFQKKGIKSIQTKEPTDEITGKLIREVLSGKLDFPPVSFQYLFAADRAIHQAEIEKYLKDGYVVISDRYLWSSVVYGMLDKGIDFKENDGSKSSLLTALSILSMYNQFILPDYSFCLRADVKTAMKRISKKVEKVEIYEKENLLEKLKDGYDWLVNKFPQEIITIDGEGEVGEVTERIISKISNS